MNLFNKGILFAGLFSTIFSSFAMVAEGHAEGSAEILGQVSSAIYLKECGACHLAYQPQFLPKRSWEKIMGALDTHFGDNAALDEATRAEILAYVVKNSAETSSAKVSRKILASLGSTEVPLRITETSYFKRKHREVRAEVFKRKSIGSPANCGGCHVTAAKGDYDENKVKIPKN
ncbi:MAG: diheme cytochrome c [Desulfurivibrionaceae bacterium]